jgi:hypothetical protein
LNYINIVGPGDFGIKILKKTAGIEMNIKFKIVGKYFFPIII